MSSHLVKILRHKVRFAATPNTPPLIQDWLDAENQCGPEHYNSTKAISNLRIKYESQFRLLLETIADDLIPSHWRCTCLDHIYKPLFELKQLADSEEADLYVQSLCHELFAISHYHHASMCDSYR